MQGLLAGVSAVGLCLLMCLSILRIYAYLHDRRMSSTTSMPDCLNSLYAANTAQGAPPVSYRLPQGLLPAL